VEIELRPRAVRALHALVLNSGRCVDYEQMIRQAWDGTLVSRHTVAVTVGEVKKALKEFGCWIAYRPNRGYCFQPPKSDDLLRTGWHFWNRRTREGFDKALDCFQKVAQEDTADARAFEGISLSYLMLALYAMRPPREMYSKFLPAHQRAVALGGMTPSLRANRGTGLHIFERRFSEAESELLRASREDPGSPIFHVRLAMLCTTLGRFTEALEALKRARAADPLYPVIPATEICVRLCRREYDRAIGIGKTALELHPYLQLGRAYYAEALELAGHAADALAQYRLASALSPDVPWLRALEAACLANLGQTAEALRILEELEQIRCVEYVDAYYMALLFAALGELDQAFLEMERAVEENSAILSLVDVDPRMDVLRGDPRFGLLRDGLFGAAEVPVLAHRAARS
jgi:tetratricopeptide (TPR) repeat protein